MNLDKQTIVVTGGNSGIGLRLVERLHGMDNALIVVSRSQNHWQQLSQQFPDIQLIQCDLSNKESVVHLAQTLKQHPVSLLINCAAVQYEPLITDPDFSFENIQYEITTNFTSVVWLCYHLIPTLAQQPTSGIVNLSSGLALFPKTTSAVYCASKAAIHSLSQSLRYQLSNTRIGVSEVILPLVDTPMTAGRGHGKITAEQAAVAIIHGIQKGRETIYVGKARLLPLLSQLWPGLLKRILKKF